MRPSKTTITMIAILLSATFMSSANAGHLHYGSKRIKMLRHARTMRTSARDFERRMKYIGISPFELRRVCALENAICELEDAIKCSAPWEKVYACYDRVDRLVGWVGRNLAPTCPVTYNRSIVRSWNCIVEAHSELGCIVETLGGCPVGGPNPAFAPAPAYPSAPIYPGSRIHRDRFGNTGYYRPRTGYRTTYRSTTPNPFGLGGYSVYEETRTESIDPGVALMRMLLARAFN